MGFKIGDKVIHLTYGLGEIVKIEEKPIHGKVEKCYVFCTSDLTVWIPIQSLDHCSLRRPTPPEEFNRLFAILTGPSEELLEDRILRKKQLMEKIKDGQLASLCRVVRDLTHFKRTTRLNDQERTILERTMNSLLTEWAYSLGISHSQAQQAVTTMLGESNTH